MGDNLYIFVTFLWWLRLCFGGDGVMVSRGGLKGLLLAGVAALGLAGCGGQAPEPVSPSVRVSLEDSLNGFYFDDEFVPGRVVVSGGVSSCVVRLDGRDVVRVDPVGGGFDFRVPMEGVSEGSHEVGVSCVYDGGKTVSDEVSFTRHVPRLDVVFEEIDGDPLSVRVRVVMPPRDGSFSGSVGVTDETAGVLSFAGVRVPESVSLSYVSSVSVSEGSSVYGLDYGGDIVVSGSWSDGKGHRLTLDGKVYSLVKPDIYPLPLHARVPADGNKHYLHVLASGVTGDTYHFHSVSWQGNPYDLDYDDPFSICTSSRSLCAGDYKVWSDTPGEWIYTLSTDTTEGRVEKEASITFY